MVLYVKLQLFVFRLKSTMVKMFVWIRVGVCQYLTIKLIKKKWKVRTKIKNVGQDVLSATKIPLALCVTKDFMLTQITSNIVLLVLILYKQMENNKFV